MPKIRFEGFHHRPEAGGHCYRDHYSGPALGDDPHAAVKRGEVVEVSDEWAVYLLALNAGCPKDRPAFSVVGAPPADVPSALELINAERKAKDMAANAEAEKAKQAVRDAHAKRRAAGKAA